jgi:hypothetical protein
MDFYGMEHLPKINNLKMHTPRIEIVHWMSIASFGKSIKKFNILSIEK